jgi:PKD domain/Secretion system C-terminal sorting domain
MSLNNGKGAVVTKNNLVKKTFRFDRSAATHHANGQDWWVLTPDHFRNKIYKFRLTPEGIADTTTQVIGYKPMAPDSTDSGGRNIFSPDGSVFVDFDARNGVRIYDFDRCTGELSNFRWVPLPYESVILMSFGTAISRNSRFLYFSRAKYILQLDLWADDIAASLDTVAVYDGWVPGQQPGFHGMLPAPDGKIYIFDFLKQIHVINKPNEKGSACDVRQGYIILPEYPAGIPYYPNYRLGPLDGSACDTLGLDNHPLARFTWELADTMNPLQVEFTDNSFYEPTEWFWDFGGTGTSTEVNPVHDFPAAGTYQVCLTVSNQYDSDTFCREVTVGVTGTEENTETFSVEVFPNPAKETAHLSYVLPPGKSAELQLFDALGREVRNEKLTTGSTHHSVSLEDLPAGLFYYSVEVAGTAVKAGKLVVLK